MTRTEFDAELRTQTAFAPWGTHSGGVPHERAAAYLPDPELPAASALCWLFG